MGDVHYCWGDFGITSEAQFASPVRVPTREVTVTSDRMRPALLHFHAAARLPPPSLSINRISIGISLSVKGDFYGSCCSLIVSK